MFSCEFCEISKNTVFYRTPPVAASVSWENHKKICLNMYPSTTKVLKKILKINDCLGTTQFMCNKQKDIFFFLLNPLFTDEFVQLNLTVEGETFVEWTLGHTTISFLITT